MKSLLITGSNGFIGTALRKHLLEKRYMLYEFNEEDGDIAQKNALDQFNKYQIDHVIHLAGKTFVPHSWHDPNIFYATNVMGSLNVLEFCKRHKIPLTFLSTYLYGIPNHLPITEDAELNPNNPYAHSKYLAEKLCQFYHREFGVKAIIFRPFNVYGYGQNALFLVPAIIDQILHTSEIKVNELTSKRDYIYLEDLIHAIMLSLHTNLSFEIFNIGSGKSLSVREVIDIIQEIFASKKKVISKNMQRKNEIPDTVANIDKIKQKLDWYPVYSFYDGICDMYKKIKQLNK
jgi:GDP-4-dehydro-6-deoxy-D-mannose reductase